MNVETSNLWLHVAYLLKLARLPMAVRDFPVVLRERLRLLGPGTSQVRLRSGLAFTCRNNTADILTVVDIGMMLEYPPDPLLRIPRDGCVLDLGGHIGTFAVLLRQLRPDLTIYTVEPSSENYELLLRNLAQNDAGGRVIPVRGAVGAFDGTADLASDGKSDGWYIQAGSDGRRPSAASPEPVRVLRLATLLREQAIPRVDFIKMDIEGAEYQVLEDARDIIGGCQGVILEVHRRINGELRYPDGDRRLIDYFRGLGFTLEKFGLGNVLYARAPGS